MYALPSVNALMQKYSTIDTYRDVFVQQFREHQQEQRAAEHDTHNNVHNHASDPRQPQAEQEAGSHNHSSEKNGEAPSSSSTKGTPTGGSPDTPCSGEEAESGKAEINQNSEASASENKTSGYSISDAEEDDFTAQEVFNKVLTDSVLYYLFVGTSVKGSDDTSSGKEGKDGNQEDAGSKLSVIFQAFLQTAAYSYQNQSSAQGDDDEGGDEGEGAGGQSSRGSAAREGAKRAQPPKFDRHDHYD